MRVIKFAGPEERKAKGYGTASVNSDRSSKITEHLHPSRDERKAEAMQLSRGTPEEPSVPRRQKKKRLSPADVIAQSSNLPNGTNEGPGEALSPKQIIARSVNRNSSTNGVLQALLTTAFDSTTRPLDPAVVRPKFLPEKDTPPASDRETTHSQEAPEPFWQIWLKHQKHLRRQALRLMAYNSEEAEDALSHAMLRASQKYNAYADTLINPLAWLTTIVQNICFDHQRSFNHTKRWEADSSPDEFAELTSSVTAAPASSLEDTVSMREAIAKLEHQLLSLPASLREPLLMRVIEEKSYQDIAEDLNMTEHTARKRIQRARARLRYGTCKRRR
jgi:RNA polymerase sigma-70 factor (ECF subfamily)